MAIASESLINEIVIVLEKFLGTYTKTMYLEFYKNQEKDVVLTSAHELFIEMMGQSTGEAIYTKIQQKYAQN